MVYSQIGQTMQSSSIFKMLLLSCDLIHVPIKSIKSILATRNTNLNNRFSNMSSNFHFVPNDNSHTKEFTFEKSPYSQPKTKPQQSSFVLHCCFQLQSSPILNVVSSSESQLLKGEQELHEFQSKFDECFQKKKKKKNYEEAFFRGKRSSVEE